MVKKLLIVMGVVFLAVGLLGYVNNPILGIFSVNMLHNLVHIASGILSLVFAFQSESAGKMYALVFGIVYALVAVLGFVASGFMASLLAVNMADNFLHIALAIVFIVIGTMKTSSSPAMPTM